MVDIVGYPLDRHFLYTLPPSSCLCPWLYSLSIDPGFVCVWGHHKFQMSIMISLGPSTYFVFVTKLRLISDTRLENGYERVLREDFCSPRKGTQIGESLYCL